MSEARLSTILFGSGKTLARLRDGKGMTIRVLDRATVRLAERERQAATPGGDRIAA